MQHSDKVAEYLVLAALIQRDVEAYSAISFRQEDYDITVVRSDRTIVRVQVKATELQNRSKNNSVKNLDRKYDYLVLVVFDGDAVEYFIMTEKEVVAAYAPGSRGVVYVSECEKGTYVVRSGIRKYEGQWEKIIK